VFLRFFGPVEQKTSRFVVSHISRKTSEMWGTRFRGRVTVKTIVGLEIRVAHLFRPTYALANLDWIRKKASAILERVLRFGAERLRDQEKPYEDYRM
jgi:hypothetical protein